MTAACSSRWAGTVTANEEQYQLAYRSAQAHLESLDARINRIARALEHDKTGGSQTGGSQTGGSQTGGSQTGDSQTGDSQTGDSSKPAKKVLTPSERHSRLQRLQVLTAERAEVAQQLESRHLTICRGGRQLAKARHNLAAAGLTEQQWRDRWEAKRRFLRADGDATKSGGNDSICWDPVTGTVDINLSASMAYYANQPWGRYRLSHTLRFPYRGDEVAAAATNGSVRYDIGWDPDSNNWYVDASWKLAAVPVPTLEQLRSHPVVSLDVNNQHLEISVLDPDGNPVGCPITIPVELKGLPASVREGHLRAALTQTINTARLAGAQALAIEDLGFDEARALGREKTGKHPHRGRRGRAWRGMIMGMPTAKIRNWITQMATNRAGRATAAANSRAASIAEAEKSSPVT